MIHLLVLFEIWRITDHGVLLNFPNEITLILNPERNVRDVAECLKKYNETLNVPLKVVFTVNFLVNRIKRREIKKLILDWAEKNIVLLPYDALGTVLKNITDKSAKYNILSLKYNDILPLSENLSISFVQRENTFNNYGKSSTSGLEEVLITYRDTTILYVYISSISFLGRRKNQKFLHPNRGIISIDLCLLSLDTEENAHILEFIDNIPYILGFEADYLILKGIAENVQREGILSMDLCNRIAFTRHLTKLYVIKRKKSKH